MTGVRRGLAPCRWTGCVNAALPAARPDGLSAPIVGTGFTFATVTALLVASRTKPLLANNRNSYTPRLNGAGTVHVRLCTPAPTYVKVTTF